ncbi:hypothetical protein RLEG12_17535 [Rhizobium leguminosarum bv. trifolii CB782]|nr:hypothetical protein RLEG12_17535 [Rhizobium leguminosarum bv. trifolii CB782]
MNLQATGAFYSPYFIWSQDSGTLNTIARRHIRSNAERRFLGY